jgi:non-ribosomal peptide synthetase component F
MVPGKRAKWREVPLPDEAVGVRRTYLAVCELSTEILENDAETPLIAKLSLDAPLTPARIYNVLVTAFERYGEHLSKGPARRRADQEGVDALAAPHLRIALHGARRAAGGAAGQSWTRKA